MCVIALPGRILCTEPTATFSKLLMQRRVEEQEKVHEDGAGANSPPAPKRLKIDHSSDDMSQPYDLDDIERALQRIQRVRFGERIETGSWAAVSARITPIRSDLYLCILHGDLT